MGTWCETDGCHPSQAEHLLFVVLHTQQTHESHRLTSSGMALPSSMRCRIDMHCVLVSNDPDFANTMIGGTAPDTIIACEGQFMTMNGEMK